MRLLKLIPLAIFIGAGFAYGSDGAIPSEKPLDFIITEGTITNRLYKNGAEADHLLLTSGRSPRILVTSPAGNSGFALWFQPDASVVDASFTPQAIATVQSGKGMHGIETHVVLKSKQLVVDRIILGSVRTIRDYIGSGERALAFGYAHESEVSSEVKIFRTTVGGHNHMAAQLVTEEGTSVVKRDNKIIFSSDERKLISLRIQTLSDFPALETLKLSELFNGNEADLPTERNVLRYLSSKEKFCAGSWRFQTYFGRDTILSAFLLLPVLGATAEETAMGSVIERMDRQGQVAHEESIGEYSFIDRPPDAASQPIPGVILDYKMIDADFLLAPFIVEILLHQSKDKSRVMAFLDRKTGRGDRYGDCLERNFHNVLAQARPFAKSPVFENLISLKRDQPVGNWRDSSNGLGGGRFPFDVNGVFVRAALLAIAELYRSGLFGPHDEAAKEAENLATEWTKARAFFDVELSAEDATAKAADYAHRIGLASHVSRQDLPEKLKFPALALNADGSKIPVMNSDVGFAVFLSKPTESELLAMVDCILLPFPLGLRSPVGLLVANPVYAARETQGLFTENDYHGTVVWSWQQALMAAGLRRQLNRSDLSQMAHDRLLLAEKAVWQLINQSHDRASGELWSWRLESGQPVFRAFGESVNDKDESNAAQLWSTVYLAVRPPNQTR